MKKCKILRLSDDNNLLTANSSSSCPLLDSFSTTSSTIASAESFVAIRRTKSSDNLTLDNSDNAVVVSISQQSVQEEGKEATVKTDFHSSFFQFKSPSSSDESVPHKNFEEPTATKNDSEDPIEDEDDATYEENECENEEDDEIDSSTSDDDSNVSEFSGLSNMSDEDTNRLLNPWLHRQIVSGVDPRYLLSKIIGNTDSIPPDVSDLTLWRIIANSLAQPRRKKLPTTTSIADVCNLIKTSKNIVVLTGAGVSVSCGIPDFRSRDGIYARLAVEYPDLPDPQAMFDIRYFSQDPRPFFKFAREIYPGQFKPSPVHRFIRKLEEREQLLRNYTQNIDTLENIAGIKNVIECHGSFASASCTKCKAQVDAAAIEKDVFEQRIPLCVQCNPNAVSPKSCELRTQDPTHLQQLVANGIMKPDIVFFGEGLPELFHNTIDSDRTKCDLLIVIGSSLKVRPVALIPSWISASVPQILINREPLHHLDFDINLLGDSDVIINQLCHMLDEGWADVCWNPTTLTEAENITFSSSPQPKPTLPVEPPLPSLDEVGSIVTLTSETTSSNLVLTELAATTSASTSITSDATPTLTTFSDSQQLEIARRRIHSSTLSPISTISSGPTIHSSNSCSESDSQNQSPVPQSGPQQLRHDSVDSAKDSGIEDSTTTNSVILAMTGEISSCQPPPISQGVKRKISSCEDDDDDDGDSDDSFDEDRTPKKLPRLNSSSSSSGSSDKELWNQQNKISLASDLPENTYFKLAHRNYIFKGAEVFQNDIEKFNDKRNIHSNPFC